MACVLSRSVLVLLLSVCGAAVKAGEPLSAATLQVTPEVTLAGALSPMAAKLLAAGNTLVVDLRGDDEGADAEARALVLAGVDYVQLPQTAKPPATRDVDFLRDLLAANAHRPVVIHCRSGNRAGLLWGAYRLDQGGALPDVLEEVAPIATSQVIRQAIADYAQSTRDAPQTAD